MQSSYNFTVYRIESKLILQKLVNFKLIRFFTPHECFFWGICLLKIMGFLKFSVIIFLFFFLYFTQIVENLQEDFWFNILWNLWNPPLRMLCQTQLDIIRGWIVVTTPIGRCSLPFLCFVISSTGFFFFIRECSWPIVLSMDSIWGLKWHIILCPLQGILSFSKKKIKEWILPFPWDHLPGIFRGGRILSIFLEWSMNL